MVEHKSSTEPATLTTEVLLQWREDLHPDIRTDKWYTVLAAATTSAHLGALSLPLLYTLAAPPGSHDAREGVGAGGRGAADERAISVQRKLKETLLKGSVLFGIPPALEGAFALVEACRQERQTNRDQAHASGPHPRDDSGWFLRQHQGVPPGGRSLRQDDSSDNGGVPSIDVVERGEGQLRAVYRHNFPDIAARMGTEMDDLKMLTLPINYGLLLSETTVLDFAETELVILASLIPQAMRKETLWHLRGCLRAGWHPDAVESVRRVSMAISEWAIVHRGPSDVPTLDEVREDRNE
ncbi:unnamed protein product [Jaminaea pallidilutea]